VIYASGRHLRKTISAVNPQSTQEQSVNITTRNQNGFYSKAQSEATLELDGQTLRASLKRINPALAAAYLQKNPSNRNLRRKTVSKYAEAMKQGRWKLNGEPIIFDSNGILRNGQHRLSACLEAKTPFYAVVIEGVSDDVFPTLDRPLVRSSADAIGLSGEKCASRLAKTLAYVSKYERKTMTLISDAPEPDVRLEVLNRHPDVREFVAKYTDEGGPVLTTHLAAFCHYTLSRIDPDEANEFMHKVMEGVGLQEGDPEFALRRVLINYRVRNDRRTQGPRGYVIVAHVFRAWQKRRVNATCKMIQWRDIEPFPYLDE
jgi:hypothetical protein